MDNAERAASMISPPAVAEEKAEAQESVIPVSGKNSELVERLAKLPRPHIQMREVPFHFKTPRSDKKNEKGEPVDELGNVLAKRATIKLNLPMITFDGLIEALEDEKQRSFIMDLLDEAVIAAARDQVGDDTNPVNDQDHLDLSKLTLAFIANQPKAERRGGGISKEIWEEFGKDYMAVMPAVSGRTAEQVGNAVKIFLAKFQPVKTQKKILSYLQSQLALWFQHTERQEEFSECYEFLEEKVKTLLAADEAAMLANL